jgi:hypothetical protein
VARFLLSHPSEVHPMAAPRPLPRPRANPRSVSGVAPECEPEGWTLLALVHAVAEATEDDGEVVATVLHLLRSGAVRLTGSFRDERL